MPDLGPDISLQWVRHESSGGAGALRHDERAASVLDDLVRPLRLQGLREHVVLIRGGQ